MNPAILISQTVIHELMNWQLSGASSLDADMVLSGVEMSEIEAADAEVCYHSIIDRSVYNGAAKSLCQAGPVSSTPVSHGMLFLPEHLSFMASGRR